MTEQDGVRCIVRDGWVDTVQAAVEEGRRRLWSRGKREQGEREVGE